jgi:hypothetical protein
MYGFAPHVTVATRRAQAERELTALRKKGRAVAPVVIEGRAIATTFWGQSWCDNLERYSDFANRLPRGRSYVRNGAVLDLQIAPGVVTALVSGSEVYEVRISVQPLGTARWQAACREVSGAIDSVIELLQGRLSDRVMTRLCADGTGLFPPPREILFTCSCPDAAFMCKHIAADVFGIEVTTDLVPRVPSATPGPTRPAPGADRRTTARPPSSKPRRPAPASKKKKKKEKEKKSSAKTAKLTRPRLDASRDKA